MKIIWLENNHDTINKIESDVKSSDLEALMCI